MQISVWPDYVAGNGNPIYKQLQEAMSETDSILDRKLGGDAGFIWSVLWFNRMSRNREVWNHYRPNKPVIVAEVGGLVRDKTWRLSANGINADALFPTVPLDYTRPTKLGLELKPWHSGEYILVCGQHGKSQQWVGMPEMGEYFKQTVQAIRKYSDRPIVLRAHPRYREGLFFNYDVQFFKDNKVEWNSPKKVVETYDSFDLDPLLSHCHCVVSHSSNAAISAVIQGVPVITGPNSLAKTMGSTKFSDIESLPTPNRNDWLVELSHKEWFEDELAYAWQGLRQTLMSSIPATRRRVM